MNAKDGHYMQEEDAREKIEAITRELGKTRNLGKETPGEDTSSVDYHIDNIKKAGGGIWNETIAKDYIQDLESQIAQETEAPAPLV